MRQRHPFRIVLSDVSGSLTPQLELFALLNLGLVQSLASGVLSPAEAVQCFYHADNCLYVRKHLWSREADAIMSHGVQLPDLFECLPAEEAQREFCHELETMRSLCLKLLEKERDMNSYGRAATKAVDLYSTGLVDSPQKAWAEAIAEIFGQSTSSQVKGCPRDAFLGLCEEGLVKGIPRGNYTRSKKNKKYALDAVTVLKRDPALAADPAGLWNKVMNGKRKVHNHQMNVVIALWRNGLLSEKA